MSSAVIGYDLWDRLDGNAIADFDDLASALDFVRIQLADGGPESVHRLALCEVTNEGRTSKVLAEGDGLVELVRKKAASR